MSETNRDILFIAAGPISWASSRMRCFWPAKHMNKSDVIVRHDERFDIPANYNTYVFQKFGDPQTQAQMRELGRKVIIDCCDPLYWFSEQSFMRDMFANSDGATFSNSALEADFKQWYGADDYPTMTIPDRLDFDHFAGHKKTHWPTIPVRFLWYGVSQNRVALHGAMANLQRLQINGYKIQLTIFDDRPDLPFVGYDGVPILYSTWDYQKEPPMLASHDIALLPPYPGPWGKVKSNNKKVTAWAAGLPTTDGLDYDELVQLMEHKERREVVRLQSLSLEHYDAKISAEEFLEFAENV